MKGGVFSWKNWAIAILVVAVIVLSVLYAQNYKKDVRLGPIEDCLNGLEGLSQFVDDSWVKYQESHDEWVSIQSKDDYVENFVTFSRPEYSEEEEYYTEAEGFGTYISESGRSFEDWRDHQRALYYLEQAVNKCYEDNSGVIVCDEDNYLDGNNNCVADEVVQDCPEGTHRDSSGCVND